MGLYRDQLLPRAVNYFMNNKQFNELRKIVTKDLRGDVLELGFGLG